ncbi:MAG: type II toxin-antitoxin system RelB/DinJ family antitoxin [Eubacteriales bacterium]
MAHINVRIDDALKQEGEEILKYLGMNTATAINIFFRQIVQHQGIPFDVKVTPHQEKELELLMNRYHSGEMTIISKTMEELEE